MNTVSRHFSQVCEALSLVDASKVDNAVEILRHARDYEKSVWIAGNGGSAATSMHLANDLVKMCGVRAFDLSGMTSLTLAYGNDLGWERMFANPLTRLVSPGDVVVAISCGGNSRNILEMVDDARDCEVIALTGTGGKLSYKDVLVLPVMADDITVVEDAHSIICHAIVNALRDR